LKRKENRKEKILDSNNFDDLREREREKEIVFSDIY